MLAQTLGLTTACVVLTGIVGGLAPVRAADDGSTYRLAYRFEAGQQVRYSVNHQAKVFLQQEEAEQHIDHGSTTTMGYRVLSVDEAGNALLELQIDRVQMTAAVDGGDAFSYDTDSSEEPPTQLQGIAETVGKPHTRVKVSPRGELLSIDWLIGGEQSPRPTKDDAASMDILVVLPEHAVTLGETWKEQFEDEVSATATLKKSVTIQREYTLESVKDGLATIALKTVVITPVHDPAQESQIVNKVPRGVITFDVGQGVLQSRTLTVDKLIVGFNGPNSKVHNVSRRHQSLMPVTRAADADAKAVRQ